MEGQGASTGGEMEWQSDQNTSHYSQMLSQQLDVTRELNDRFNSMMNKLNIDYQACLQATPDLVEQTIRNTLNEHLTRHVLEAQPATRQLSAPSESQSLPESADPDYMSQIRDLNHKLMMKESELSKIKGQLKVAETEAEQLRDIIIPNDGETILDNEVQKLFSEVRSLTQRVVKKLYKATGKYCHLTEKNGPFFDSISGRSLESQEEAIWAHLFAYLNFYFFCDEFTSFGLGKRYRKLEESLSDTEYYLREAFRAQSCTGMSATNRDEWRRKKSLTAYYIGAYGKEIAEWRHATFKCVNLLKDTSDSPAIRYQALESFFKPAETHDPKASQRGKGLLKDLCEKSYELGILMRRAQDTFQVFEIKRKTDFTDCEHEVDELRFNGDRRTSHEPKVIQECLFGGLRKISRDYPTSPVLLEKAVVSTQSKMSSR
ncbi:hypothetical protein FOTG_12785 [Fusarium oxysporum f. sp. vasinfectum 25433]|uniref:Uncharacterized protein n=1 Tax=Fusarium oxysporum f. sp. vasinfectum 25433 TaxID=1089449 RepID=X0LDH0_FUSOX|nr:hypothetical protein FOTG_12785 [Fusarium oxysporum f. sp. vasinfectum 25433]